MFEEDFERKTPKNNERQEFEKEMTEHMESQRESIETMQKAIEKLTEKDLKTERRISDLSTLKTKLRQRQSVARHEPPELDEDDD